jgi:hypothetical protein
MSNKFTFKTEKAVGKYRSFYSDFHTIKLNKEVCGTIDDKEPYKISLMVVKDDINEDGNPNCKWKWIASTKEFKTLQEAKDFLSENFEAISSQYTIYKGKKE